MSLPCCRALFISVSLLTPVSNSVRALSSPSLSGKGTTLSGSHVLCQPASSIGSEIKIHSFCCSVAECGGGLPHRQQIQ